MGKSKVEMALASGNKASLMTAMTAWNLLQNVCDNKLTFVAQQLVAGVDINYIGGEFACSALHTAAERGRVEIAKLLIEAGADVNIQRFRSLEVPLHSAAEHGHVEIARLLIKAGADVNAADFHGELPWHKAAERGHIEIVELLIEHGVAIAARTDAGMTALHLAAWGGHADIVILLIEHGADVNAADNSGEIALHNAAYRCKIDVARLLIEKGAKVNAVNNDGETPLHKVLDNVRSRYFGCVNNPRKALAHTANIEFASLLIEKGADVNAADNDGNTPLILAENDGYPADFTSLLINASAMRKSSQ